MFRKLLNFFVFYVGNNKIKSATKEDMTRFYLANLGGLTAYSLAVAVFLPGFAIFIGAGDTLSSIISSMGVYCFLPMFLSPLIYEKLIHRKKVISRMQVAANLLMCGSIVIPLIWSGQAAGIVLLIVIIISMILYGMVKAGTNVWVMEIVEYEYRAKYFSKRELMAKLTICVVVFVLGLILDYYNKGYTGFLIIYLTAYAFATIQILQLNKITDTTYELSDSKTTLTDLFKIPLKNKHYRNLTFYIAVFFFIAWLCYSFRSIYMLRYLKISYVLFSVLFSYRMIVQAASSPVWGNIAIKKGWFNVFVLSLVCFSLEYVSWVFVTLDNLWILFVVHTFSGIANGGLVLSSLNIRYEKMPKIQRSIYEGFYNLVLGIACILGPLAGNLIRVNMPVITGKLFPNSQMQFVFLLSFVINNMLIVYLKINKKKFGDTLQLS